MAVWGSCPRRATALTLVACLLASCSGGDDSVSSHRLQPAPRVWLYGGQSDVLSVELTDGEGMRMTRIEVDGNDLRVSDTAEVGDGLAFDNPDVVQLPSGDWLVSAPECEGISDDICNGPPTRMWRVEPSGDAELVAEFDSEVRLIGASDEEAVVSRRRSFEESGSYTFEILDLTNGSTRPSQWNPFPGAVEQAGPSRWVSRQLTCVAGDSLKVVTGEAEFQPDASYTLHAGSFESGRTELKVLLPYTQGQGPFGMVCLPDGSVHLTSIAGETLRSIRVSPAGVLGEPVDVPLNDAFNSSHDPNLISVSSYPAPPAPLIYGFLAFIGDRWTAVPYDGEAQDAALTGDGELVVLEGKWPDGFVVRVLRSLP